MCGLCLWLLWLRFAVVRCVFVLRWFAVVLCGFGCLLCLGGCGVCFGWDLIC